MPGYPETRPAGAGIACQRLPARPNYDCESTVKLTRTAARSHGGRELIFEEFQRPEFIRRALIVELDAANSVVGLYFNSTPLGTVTWTPEAGLLNCRSWETEDAAMSGSFLQRMFPTVLHNGAERPEFAARIVTDVLSGDYAGAVQVKLRAAIDECLARGATEFFKTADAGELAG